MKSYTSVYTVLLESVNNVLYLTIRNSAIVFSAGIRMSHYFTARVAPVYVRPTRAERFSGESQTEPSTGRKWGWRGLCREKASGVQVVNLPTKTHSLHWKFILQMVFLLLPTLLKQSTCWKNCSFEWNSILLFVHFIFFLLLHHQKKNTLPFLQNFHVSFLPALFKSFSCKCFQSCMYML